MQLSQRADAQLLRCITAEVAHDAQAVFRSASYVATNGRFIDVGEAARLAEEQRLLIVFNLNAVKSLMQAYNIFNLIIA